MIALFARLFGIEAWLIGAGLAAAVALAVGAMAWTINDRAYDRGYAARAAEAEAETRRRLKDVTDADEAHRACAADPHCRLQSDGFRRD